MDMTTSTALDQTVRLTRHATGSVITLMAGQRQLNHISYTQPTHKYRSDSDYQTLVTELRTYGQRALIETFDYLASTR